MTAGPARPSPKKSDQPGPWIASLICTFGVPCGGREKKERGPVKGLWRCGDSSESVAGRLGRVPLGALLQAVNQLRTGLCYQSVTVLPSSIQRHKPNLCAKYSRTLVVCWLFLYVCVRVCASMGLFFFASSFRGIAVHAGIGSCMRRGTVLLRGSYSVKSENLKGCSRQMN